MRKTLSTVLLLSLILNACSTGPMSVKVGKLNSKTQVNAGVGTDVVDRIKDTADKFLGVNKSQEEDEEGDDE
ncbi:MAG: hypothetical protein U0354_13970 [Candidatus Sericytochromatia bacterium]